MSNAETYNGTYYKNYSTSSGFVDYADNAFWGDFFKNAAQKIVENHNPKTVLDAGCALGFLVYELRKLGVEAYGIDISEYAINHVPEEVRPYCFVGSLTEEFPSELPKKFDLVTNIEVIEHLYAQDGDIAIEKLCSLTDFVLFSSDPNDTNEKTHVNVQQPEYWIERFARHGFYHVLDYDATYYTEHTMLFQKKQISENELIFSYERSLRYWKEQLKNTCEKYGENKQLAILLFDFGQGYQENRKVYLCHTTDTPMIHVGVTVPEGVKKIKLELAPYRCVVTDFEIVALSDSANCVLSRTNGLKVSHGMWIFNTENPYYEFVWEGTISCVLKVDLNIMLLINEAEFNIIHEHALKLNTHYEQLMNDEKERQRLLYENFMSLQREQESQKVNNLEIQLNVAKQDKQIAREQLKQVALEKQVAEEKLQQTQQQDQIERQNEIERGNYFETKCMLLENDLNNMRASYECISNSRFWKITKPLRVTLDFLKALRGKKQEVIPQSAISDGRNMEPTVSVNVANQNSLAMYMPESVIHNRISVEKMVMQLEQYDVISFDIFDTLIFRVVNEPKDVFRIIAHDMQLESFYKMRIAAEQEARDNGLERNGEITIYDIYQVLKKTLNIDIEVGVAREIETEKRVCIPNTYMQEVYNALKAQNKKIVFTSDMYLLPKFLYELLSNCGYELKEEDIYVSCEHGCNKGSGLLQQLVFKSCCKFGESFIHIGDNWVGDVERTQNVGLEAFYYESCHNIGDKFRPKNFDRLSNSIYNAVVNYKLHADDKVYSPEYEHGFKYAGYLTCGFCEWLNRYATKNEIDKILFLARDTDVISKVYNQFYYKVENEYMVISRMAMWILVFENHTEEFINYFFKNRVESSIYTLGTALLETDLGCLIPYLQEYGLRSDDILNTENYLKLHDCIYEKKHIILKHFEPSILAGKKYIAKIIGSSQNICVVDLGWSGQILVQLREVVNNLFGDLVTIHGAYVAMTENKEVNSLVENGVVDSYICSYGINNNLLIKTDTFEGNMFAKIMEATFTSDKATLLKYTLNETETECSFVYGAKTNEKSQIDNIQKGIIDFARLYNQYTNKVIVTNILFAIDAFKPMKMIEKDFLYHYKLFSENLETEISLPSFLGNNSYTTLGQIMKKWNLIG